MNIQDIRKMAKEHHINCLGKSKIEIVRALQGAEGNFDCYGRATSGFCDQGACLWKEDCLKDSAGAPAPKTGPKAPTTVKKAPARKK